MNDINLAVPYFSQRNNYYKWENSESKKESFYIAAVSCNLTSLCMTLNYLSITDDKPAVLSDKVFKTYDLWNRSVKGYDNLTYWSNLNEIPSKIYGIQEKYVKSLTGSKISDSIEKYLNNGYPIMFSIGTLSSDTTTGHIVILRGRIGEKYYIINDPWGDPTNPFGELESQKGKIRGLYTAKESAGDVLFGRGSGDNCILSKEAFKIATGYLKNEDLHFNGAMTIAYPFIYVFPLRKDFKFGINNLDSIYSLYKTKCRYLLNDNGRLLRGMEFINLQNAAVYSCGPGRVVAVKNCRNTEKNFIIVQYSIPHSRGKFFYVNYKRLNYIDIDKLLQENIYIKDEGTEDFIKQIINKIKPKKVVYDKGKITGDSHVNLNLQERGYVYLVPTEEKLKDYVENLDNNSCSPFDVNDLKNYKIKENKKDYYFINGEKVLTDNLIPQTINFKEYEYYREKLKSLRDGKITFFCDEDYKQHERAKDFVNEKNYKMYFKNALQDVFYELDFSNSSYESVLKEVEKYYIKQINNITKKTSKNNLWSEFVNRCKILCRKLLEMPWNEQEWAFSLNDKWLKGGTIKNEKGKIVGNFESLSDIYIRIQEEFLTIQEESQCSVPTWDDFLKDVSLFYPSNVDYYIEVCGQTLLGTASSNIEIECFSEENLLETSKEILIDNFSKVNVIKVLKENAILVDKNFSFEKDYLTEDDVVKFNNNDVPNIKNIVLKLKNPFTSEFAKELEKKGESLKGMNYADISSRENFKIENTFFKNIIDILHFIFSMNVKKKYFIYYNFLTFLEEIQKNKEN